MLAFFCADTKVTVERSRNTHKKERTQFADFPTSQTWNGLLKKKRCGRVTPRKKRLWQSPSPRLSPLVRSFTYALNLSMFVPLFAYVCE